MRKEIPPLIFLSTFSGMDPGEFFCFTGTEAINGEVSREAIEVIFKEPVISFLDRLFCGECEVLCPVGGCDCEGIESIIVWECAFLVSNASELVSELVMECRFRRKVFGGVKVFE